MTELTRCGWRYRHDGEALQCIYYENHGQTHRALPRGGGIVEWTIKDERAVAPAQSRAMIMADQICAILDINPDEFEHLGAFVDAVAAIYEDAQNWRALEPHLGLSRRFAPAQVDEEWRRTTQLFIQPQDAEVEGHYLTPRGFMDAWKANPTDEEA